MSLAFLAEIGTNSAKAWRCCISCSQGAKSERRSTWSSLLATSKVGTSLLSKASTLASAWLNIPASTTNRIKSTSLTAPTTVLFSERLSALLWRVWKPGVSTNTNCVAPRVCMPVMRWRVVCALRDVILTFCPTSAFISVDLPTLGLPTMATNPQRCPSGPALGSAPFKPVLSRPCNMASSSCASWGAPSEAGSRFFLVLME